MRTNSLYLLPDNVDEEAVLMLRDILPTGFKIVAQIAILIGRDDVDIAVEYVGLGVKFKICQDIMAKSDHIANVSVQSKPVNLHLETLWIKILC